MLLAAWRESRGARGRLLFFVACLALGVSAVVGVAGLVGAIETGIRGQARELLGADLVVSSFRPLPEALTQTQAQLATGAQRTDVRELSTMARSAKSGRSQIVDLKAVSGRFPFHGKLTLDPPGTLEQIVDSESCAVAPELLAAWNLAVGDQIDIGSARYTIAARVLDEPGRLGFAFTAGPRVFLTLEGLERAQLSGFGARQRNKALFAYADESTLPGGSVNGLVSSLKKELAEAEYLRFETYRQAQPTVRRAIERVENYLGLVALLSLILGGVGVAMIVRAWIAERTGAVAVLRCLGYRPREVLALYAGNVVLLALVASLIGGLAGSFLPLFVPLVAADLLPTGITIAWSPAPMLRGIALGVGIALCFSIPPLLAIWRVSPARVLRHEAEPLRIPFVVRFGAMAILALGVFGAAWAQSRSLLIAAAFTGGLALLAGVLALAARGLTKLAARLPRERMSPYLVHGVAALSRPGAGVIGAALALGFGVLVVLTMALCERELSTKLRTAIPADAPTTFFVDVQPDQWKSVEAALEDQSAAAITQVPVLTARLHSIDGVPIDEMRGQPGAEEDPGRRRGRWALTREQRITWFADLPSSNRITAGEWWSDPNLLEMSLEEDFAEDIGATLGTRLAFDVQGVPIELTVTSLRTVEWESFQINFFLVAEPGAFDTAPHMVLGAARVEGGSEDELQDDLAAVAPNVTMIRLRAILDKVMSVLERLAVAVRVLGLFTIVTGLVILAGVASSTALRRGREVALLKTLGVTRAGVTGLFVTEFALLGLVSGIVGACAAFALSWAFLDRVLDLGADLPWWWLPATAAATALLSAVCGIAATARALATRPIESLRSG